jgi:hypothetical protein
MDAFKMNIKFGVLMISLFCFRNVVFAQLNKDVRDFPEFLYSSIAGAPKLDRPILIDGEDKRISGEGFGLAAPAWWDWNNDGLKDLLIGEFGSGVEFGEMTGNFIRVYLNDGTSERPDFTGKFNYARAPFKIITTGTPYSVDQHCCIGFTPQFVDLNQDGQIDIISGTYYGEVMWLKGTQEGFLSAEPLLQEGNPRGRGYLEEQDYWLFSSASAGDFTGDGLPDLVIGGRSIRISKNIGTKENPMFSRREALLDVNGKPLKVYDFTNEDRRKFQVYVDTFGKSLPVGGDSKLSPYVIDWDSDGILDLLVTNSYAHSGLSVIDFFKGVKISGEHRFQESVALFEACDQGKSFPGSAPRIFVADYNGDGVNDVIIGTSVVNVNGEFSWRFSWNWEDEEGIHSVGKDPGIFWPHFDGPFKDSQLKYYRDHLPEGVSLNEYVTMRHRGLVYVMLGRK